MSASGDAAIEMHANNGSWNTVFKRVFRAFLARPVFLLFFFHWFVVVVVVVVITVVAMVIIVVACAQVYQLAEKQGPEVVQRFASLHARSLVQEGKFLDALTVFVKYALLHSFCFCVEFLDLFLVCFVCLFCL